MLAYGGLRIGEALALRPRRIDLGRGRLLVSGSLADVGGQLHFGPAKTHQTRHVVLPDFLARLHAELTFDRYGHLYPDDRDRRPADYR